MSGYTERPGCIENINLNNLDIFLTCAVTSRSILSQRNVALIIGGSRTPLEHLVYEHRQERKSDRIWATNEGVPY